MLRKQDNITYTVVGTQAAGVPAAAGIASATTVAAGAVAVVDEGNVILDATAYTALASDRTVRLVQNIAGELFFTAAMTKGAIKTSTHAYTAPIQQVTRIGFDGVSAGAMPVANDTSYFIKIRKNDPDAANRSQPSSLFAQFKTDATGSQSELAMGLVKNGVKNMEDEPANGYLRFEALCDDAGAASTAASGTITFTYGSTTVTTSGATPATDYPVGAFIRFGTALTDAVYEVVAVSNPNQTITLGSAYEGASGTLTVTNHEFITAVLAAAADFGVQMRGVEAPFDVDAFRNYYTNRFTANFSDSSVLNTHVSGATNGVGTWQEAAMNEYLSMGFQGQNEMTSVPPKSRTSSVTSGSTYSTMMITADESISGLVSDNTETGKIILYGELAVAGTSAFAAAAVFGVVLP